MTQAPTSLHRGLAELPSTDARDADGKRVGLWNAGDPQGPKARTTYVDGCPDGPFYWPGDHGWSEGVLKPVGTASDALASWWRTDANGVFRSGYGAAVATEDRFFNRDGQCVKEFLRDDEGRWTRIRDWDKAGELESERTFVEGKPHGLWGFRKGKRWVTLQVENGRVSFESDEAARLGKLFTKTGEDWGDPGKLTTAIEKEIGHTELYDWAVLALVRAGQLDPLANKNVLMAVADRPGWQATEVDALLDDARAFPSIPQLMLLPGWPNTIDLLVTQALPTRPLDAWLDRARALTGERRMGLLFVLGRYGAALTAEELEEVGLALLEGNNPYWDMMRVRGPEGGDQSFRGKRQARILALFGL